MKHSFKKSPGSIIELSVELSLDEFRVFWDTARANAKSHVELKGFRKGMVPDTLAEQVIDQKKVADEAAEKAIRETLQKTIEDYGWTIIDQPKVELADKATSFSYTATFSIFPEIILGNYDSILEKRRAELTEKIKTVAVSEEEFAQAIEWLRKARTKQNDQPQTDDEFAKSVGSFKTFEELKASITEGLRLEKINRHEQAACLRILEDIAAISTIDVPQVMVQKIKEQATNLDEAIAKKKLITHLIIHTIAEREKLQPTEEEVAEELARHSHELKKNEIDNRKLHDYIYERIQQNNVYRKLLGTNRN